MIYLANLQTLIPTFGLFQHAHNIIAKSRDYTL